MATKATVYYKSGRKNAVINYSDVKSIKAGTALQVLGREDCDGNGLPHNAPVITLYFNDGSMATFDADNVTIIF